jgi:hypothetical protein
MPIFIPQLLQLAVALSAELGVTFGDEDQAG